MNNFDEEEEIKQRMRQDQAVAICLVVVAIVGLLTSIIVHIGIL